MAGELFKIGAVVAGGVGLAHLLDQEPGRMLQHYIFGLCVGLSYIVAGNPF